MEINIQAVLFICRMVYSEAGRRVVKTRLCFYILGTCSFFALEAGAAEAQALSRLSPSHMQYLKSCFALERGDVAKAKDELHLAEVLDEGSHYLHLAMQRRKASPSSSEERFQGELLGLPADEHSRAGLATKE
jgi:hypothetical protein